MSLSFECCICFDEIKKLKELSQLSCDHVICLKCANRLIVDNKIKCPICRVEIEDIILDNKNESVIMSIEKEEEILYKVPQLNYLITERLNLSLSEDTEENFNRIIKIDEEINHIREMKNEYSKSFIDEPEEKKEIMIYKQKQKQPKRNHKEMKKITKTQTIEHSEPSKSIQRSVLKYDLATNEAINLQNSTLCLPYQPTSINVTVRFGSYNNGCHCFNGNCSDCRRNKYFMT